ncbi:MAG: hypothetical protein SW833_15795 [Cyanobacteriota bacterium]|nr:hypothetical protein [Cyanobacteriota bacterium]
MDSTQDEREDNLTEIVESDEVNSIYFNEFSLGVSKNDILIVLRRNGKTEAVLNASHITSKSLATSLGEVLKKFEDATNQKILDSDDIEKLIENKDEDNT